jgi:hypothetical protein
MARGWESKSVESQQDLALERSQRAQHALTARELTQAQIEHDTKRDSLELQRKRILRELSTCRNDRVRKTMENGLAFLEAQLAALASAKGN